MKILLGPEKLLSRVFGYRLDNRGPRCFTRERVPAMYVLLRDVMPNGLDSVSPALDIASVTVKPRMFLFIDSLYVF